MSLNQWCYTTLLQNLLLRGTANGYVKSLCVIAQNCMRIYNYLQKKIVFEKLVIYVWMYFWKLYFALFFYVSILLPIPHYINYYNFTINLEFSGNSTLFFFFWNYIFYLEILVLLTFHIKFKSACKFLQNILLGYWLVLY